MMDLFIAILKQLLVEKTYAATAAELHHSLYTSEKGVIVKVDGYNQKLTVKLNIFTFFTSLITTTNIIF